MYNSKEIRQQFIEFFLSKGHTHIASSPVVPVDDNTLLFTNAGMNQFKNIFLGQKNPDVLRAVNSQKCIRAGGKHNDLEEVGKDGYHHTFFEMLGNWSFGDYYKEEAITWAWELFTEVWKLPKDRLHATVHDTDSEAFELWQIKTDIDPKHISYHGDKDNFWEMGESGPCGPCSEIHFDRGAEFCHLTNDKDHVCRVNGDCHRYIELWNLVFIQYFRDENGSLTPLKNRFVDTGAGLERICQIIQGKTSNYDTDLFIPILFKVADLSGVEYTEETGVSHRVIADHIRALCFALADGGFPSNEGRGYVLRRILRRAARHGRLIGFLEPFMWKLVDTVIDIMGHHYSELRDKSAYIKMVIKAEEERFNQTLDKGLELFETIASNSGQTTISGKDAFMLYDTYGFPLDLSQILAEERGMVIDLDGFGREMELQKQRARSASKFSIELNDQEWIELSPPTPTEFVGYDMHSASCSILRYYIGNDGSVGIQLDKTPFYAESGGQLSDTGTISNSSFNFKVNQVKKIDEYYIHVGTLVNGVIDNPIVLATINSQRRFDIEANHSATHLLHKALRDLLGEHVQQKGSLVSPDYLRFDFTHHSALNINELRQIETIINSEIRQNTTVETKHIPINQAREEGAIALFGEKYKDVVRVVSVLGISKELCGGTHVRSTGSIGSFKILSESSIAAGIRRIEAITSRAVEEYIIRMEDRFKQLSSMLNCGEAQILSKVENLLSNLNSCQKDLEKIKLKSLETEINSIIKSSTEYNNRFLICQSVPSVDTETLRQIGDILKDKTKNTISVLFSVIDDKVSILCVISPELSKEFHAGKIVGKIAELVDGKGGGRPDTAMAGGKNVSAIESAIAQVPSIIFGI